MCETQDAEKRSFLSRVPAMPAPQLATSDDLAAWADRTESRAEFPDLIRRLVLDAPTPTRVSFRSHAGTDLGGYDGWVESPVPTPFVPAGTSVWEIGTNKDVRRKANGDLKARTDDPDPADPAATEFVFCTPRRWPQKEKWVERAQGGAWKDVRAYDADDIGAWLAASPGTHVWFSLRLGIPADAVRDLRSWWTGWSEATAPPIGPAFLSAGRVAAVEALLQEIQSGPGVTVVQAGSPDEARAFVASTLLAAEVPEAERLLNAALVVDDRPTWRFFASQSRPLLLIPAFSDSEGFEAAVRGGHRVVLTVGASYAGRTTVEVPPLSAVMAMDVLVEQGVGRAEARHGAALARRSLLAYRRIRSVHPLALDPAWASASDGPFLVGPLLIGRWNGARDDDRALVEAISGRPYTEVEAAVRRSGEDPDPAFKRTGTVWKATAKESAWIALSRYATADDLRRFTDHAVEVLLEEDPLYGLGSAERLEAQMNGTERPHSPTIRAGLADSLAMLGSLGEGEGVRLGDGTDPKAYSSHAVRRMAEAAREVSGRWALLAPHLPDLAEAAPDAFLTELEADLRAAEPTVFQLYEPQPGLLSPNYEYPSLLWALEKLAWSPDYLVRVARALGQIEAGAPPTQLVNSAFDSLMSFFRPWLPQCGGSPDTRLAALEQLRARTPDVAWKVMLRMLNTGHDSASIRSGPGRRAVLWRSWPSEATRPTKSEVHDVRRAVSERLVEDAGADAERWATLAGRLHEISVEVRERAIESLVAACGGMGEPDRAAIWEALRALLTHHGSYPDAPWSMSADLRERLGEVADEIAPTAPHLVSRWLFEQRPRLLRLGDREEWKQLPVDRQKAVGDLLAAQGLDGVFEFSLLVESPESVGEGLARFDGDGQHLPDVLDLLRDSAPHRAFALGYLHLALRRAHPARIDDVLGSEWERGLAPDLRALVFRQLPLDASLLDQVEASSPDVQRHYWESHPFTWTDDPVLHSRIIEALLTNGLPRFALDVLATGIDGDRSANVDLTARTVHASLTTPIEEDSTRISSYDLARVLAYLKENDDDRQRLVGLEWLSLPIITHDRPDLVLHDELDADPALFLDIVEIRYKNDDGETSGRATADAAGAAYHLMSTWDRVPGLGADGSFDEDHFNAWVEGALRGAEERGYVVAGHIALGSLLAFGPKPQDGVWPHPAVCRVIEDVSERALEDEFHVAVRNRRGTTSRGSFDGGAQEQTIAEAYDGYAAAHADEFPRVAALLRRMAADYRSDAKRMDLDVEHREDDLG